MKPEMKARFQLVDPVLFSVLTKLEGHTHTLTPRVTSDYFADLCEAIINQQLSDKAGATIFGRFKELFPKEKIMPKPAVTLKEEQIRAIGASWSKARFIKDLAEKVTQKEIRLETLKNLSDERVIAELTKIKGIGPWTAEMFLMFSLGREDIFSYGDLGLRRAIQKLYGFKKEPTRKQMEKIVHKWTPYRTYACRILWRSLEL